MLTEPTGSSVLVTSALWLQQLLLGTVATLIATVAVAAIGFSLLTGRWNVRRGLGTLLGIFILFGAPGLARALHDLAQYAGSEAPSPAPVAPSLTPPPAVDAPTNDDPYAGAGLPTR